MPPSASQPKRVAHCRLRGWQWRENVLAQRLRLKQSDPPALSTRAWNFHRAHLHFPFPIIPPLKIPIVQGSIIYSNPVLYTRRQSPSGHQVKSPIQSAYLHLVLGSKKEAPVTWGFFFFFMISPAFPKQAHINTKHACTSTAHVFFWHTLLEASTCQAEKTSTLAHDYRSFISHHDHMPRLLCWRPCVRKQIFVLPNLAKLADSPWAARAALMGSENPLLSAAWETACTGSAPKSSVKRRVLIKGSEG
jgi:hypothetical protein